MPAHAPRARFLLASVLVTCFCSRVSAVDREGAPIPLTNVHAHNDYEHEHPLFDALACGFCSVEADINLVDGQLLVAHSLAATKPERTLQSLYLDPLRKRTAENGGRVYRDGPPVWLLIDFKTDPKTTYPVLRHILEQYGDILTIWRDGQVQQGAVIAILTGDHPPENLLAAEKVRYAAIDGKLEDLQTNPPADLVPWISGQWSRSFSWHGRADFPEPQRQKLREIVAKSHEQHRLVRFWGAPDNVTTWKELLAAGVDLINTDDLRGAQQFLLQQHKSQAQLQPSHAGP